MKRALITTLILALLITAQANTPTTADTLAGIAARIASPADLIITTCPEFNYVSACIIGTGSKNLDKSILERYITDLGYTWLSPWVQPGDDALGRAFQTELGQTHVMIAETRRFNTLIVIWIP